ncbi:MAG: PIG-L deacetylase family protein [Nocardioidaceae bacterium]
MTGRRFTLVSFHAHPDDEALLTGGTLAKAAAEGHRVVLVTATAGELGLAASHDGRGDLLARTRSRELEASARALGVARVVVLGHPDSGLHPEGTGFATMDVDELARELAALLTEERADVLTVYDRHGGYGHPDHVQVHRVGTRAAALAGTPVVLEATVSAGLYRGVLRVLAPVAARLGLVAPLGTREVFSTRREITHRIDVRAHLAAKRAAMRAHASQQRADGAPRAMAQFLRLPGPLYALVFGREWFVEQGRTPGRVLGDVFASLR